MGQSIQYLPVNLVPRLFIQYLFVHCIDYSLNISISRFPWKKIYSQCYVAQGTQGINFFIVLYQVSLAISSGCISDLACDSCFFHQFSLSDRKSFQPLSRKLMKNLYSAWSCSTILVTWHTYSRKPHLIRN